MKAASDADAGKLCVTTHLQAARSSVTAYHVNGLAQKQNPRGATRHAAQWLPSRHPAPSGLQPGPQPVDLHTALAHNLPASERCSQRRDAAEVDHPDDPQALGLGPSTRLVQASYAWRTEICPPDLRPLRTTWIRWRRRKAPAKLRVTANTMNARKVPGRRPAVDLHILCRTPRITCLHRTSVRSPRSAAATRVQSTPRRPSRPCERQTPLVTM